jgi:hypothetical protein
MCHHHHRLLLRLGLNQLCIQPGQLLVAHTTTKHHKAPLQALHALWAVLVLGCVGLEGQVTPSSSAF